MVPAAVPLAGPDTPVIPKREDAHEQHEFAARRRKGSRCPGTRVRRAVSLARCEGNHASLHVQAAAVVFRSGCALASTHACVVNLNSAGVTFISKLIETQSGPSLRLVLTVYAACPTRREDLAALLRLQAQPKRLQVRLAVCGREWWAGRWSGSVICCYGPEERATLIVGPAANLDTAPAADDSAISSFTPTQSSRTNGGNGSTGVGQPPRRSASRRARYRRWYRLRERPRQRRDGQLSPVRARTRSAGEE